MTSLFTADHLKILLLMFTDNLIKDWRAAFLTVNSKLLSRLPHLLSQFFKYRLLIFHRGKNSIVTSSIYPSEGCSPVSLLVKLFDPVKLLTFFLHLSSFSVCWSFCGHYNQDFIDVMCKKMEECRHLLRHEGGLL